MNAIPLCRVSIFLPFIKFLNQLGSPIEQLLEQAKFPIFALDHPDALIPLYQAFRFVEQAAYLEKIELGIIVAQQTPISDLGLIGHLMQQSLTLYDLIRTIEQFIPAVNSTERVWLKEDGDRVWLHHHYTCPPTIKCQQARLYAILLHLKAVRLATGDSWHPLEVHFNSEYLKKLTELEEFANVPLHFNCPTDAFAIPKSLLNLPLQTSKEFQLLSPEECRQRLQASAPSADFSSSLQQLLQSLLRDGYPDISLAAEAAGISIRSLQRRLANVNLNYSQVVERVRFDWAVQLLHDPSIQLIDIASELGYTDAANFTRAFKRWTGVSPRQFRRLQWKI